KNQRWRKWTEERQDEEQKRRSPSGAACDRCTLCSRCEVPANFIEARLEPALIVAPIYRGCQLSYWIHGARKKPSFKEDGSVRIGIVGLPWESAKPPDPGGSIGRWTWEVARRLARSDDVMVCAPLIGAGAVAETVQGVRFVRFRVKIYRWLRSARRMSHFFHAPSTDFASIFYHLAYAVRAAYALRAHRCDEVHIHNFSQFVPVVRALNPQARIFLHMHCDWIPQLDFKLINARLATVDVIAGCSDYVTDRIGWRFPYYAGRCMTLYRGVDTDLFRPRDESAANSAGARIVFGGRLRPENGLHVLFDAFELVAAFLPDAHLEILDGESAQPAEFIPGLSDDPRVQGLRRIYGTDRYVKHLGWLARGALGRRISFLGHLPPSELRAHLREADVFVQPSLWGEPFPPLALEAMASGVPVVASRIGGLPEAVEDGMTGILVEPDNAGQLARALLRLLKDATLRREMGRAARVRAEQSFSWDQTVARIKSRYEASNSVEPGKPRAA
ncbi:MAG TPA: glycosyltransferase family 4 protein, partial [Candidatus Binataceae bacterium]|nr:glycosyltransferase family 4 protein [Candidatus Binataceae bacterium]